MKYQNLPEELKKSGLFCFWKREVINGRTTKVPYRLDNRRARSTERGDFVSFETARRNADRFDGIGLGIFDGWCAVDIDHCYKDGKLSDIAGDIIQTLSSYTEISPSGKGIRIIFRAEKLRFDKDRYYINNRDCGLEVYVSGATNKYVTLTGNTLVASPVRECSEEITVVLEKYMCRAQHNKPARKAACCPTAESTDNAPAQSPTHKQCISAEQSPAESCIVKSASREYSDDELINKIIRSKQGAKFLSLWNGRQPTGKSHSEADITLCRILAFWCGGNTDRMDKLFRQSKLYRRKWERADYRKRTLNRAVSHCTAFYKG